jgi:adenylate cyclase
VKQGAHTWEIDEFCGDNAGLIVAEIELTAEDEVFELPSWAGEDVTQDPRYYNVNLVKHPFNSW